MKDHSHWQGGLQVNENLTNDFMRYYRLPATHALQSKGGGKCIINKPAPFPWLKGSTCFNYPAVIWTRSALRSVTQISHQRASEINTAAALCIQGETQSGSVFVFPSVWVWPHLSCMAHVVEQKDRRRMRTSLDLCLSDRLEQRRHQSKCGSKKHKKCLS